jgi:hypothetical protein
MRSFRNRAIAWPALVFILALAVRLYAIDRQSLWSDEGGTIALSLRSLAQISHDTAQDVHPPLYYWALHVWMIVLGTSVFSVRSFSAICGAATVCVTYLLGRRWFGQPAATIAATAGALSPLAIHYSQETRMYALVAMLGALAWLALDGWLVHQRWRLLALFWLAALAAICSHYFAGALLAATNVIWLISLVMAFRQKRIPGMSRSSGLAWRPALAWVGGQALLLGLAVLLIARNRIVLTSWPTSARGSFGPASVASDTLRVFSQGPSAASGWSSWQIGFLLLLAAGLLVPARRSGPLDGRLLAAVWLFVPLGLMAGLTLAAPLYQPRFLLLALPAFHLLIGHGASVLGQRLRAAHLAAAAAAVFLALAARQPLTNEWFNRDFWRDDYRGLAHDIAASAGPDDAIMALGVSQIETLDYYNKDTQPRFLLPRTRPLDRAATIHELESIAARYRRLYALFYVPYEADPDGLIAAWLRDHAFTSSSRWYGGVQLVTYEFGELTDPLRPIHASFGSEVRLRRGGIGPTAVSPKAAVRILLEWDLPTSPAPSLSLFAHLLDGNGRIVSQCDLPLMPGERAAQTEGTAQQRRLAILVPANTAPATYRLVLGVYNSSTGARLQLANGDDILKLADITVTPDRVGAVTSP